MRARRAFSAIVFALTMATGAACVGQLAGAGRADVRVHAHGSAAAPGGAEAPPAAPLPAPPPLTSNPQLIAGTPVVRVGVNFEDQGLRGDRDYNDAVLCFEGRFNVDRTWVVSTEDQQVVATTSCRHRVHVEIHHADGSREAPVEFDSNAGVQVPMAFRVGSRLEVTTATTAGDCTPAVSMHEADGCRVLLDQCNTTGR